MHTLEEFENITSEVIKNPQDLTDITKETVDLAEKSLEVDQAKTEKEEIEDQEIEL